MLPQESFFLQCLFLTEARETMLALPSNTIAEKQRTVTLGEEINICREGSYVRAKTSILPSQRGILEVPLSFSSFSFAFSKLL